MATNALPLILGVAAAALILGKKGKGSPGPSSSDTSDPDTSNPDTSDSTPNQIVVIEWGDTQAEAEAFFDKEVYDGTCVVAVVINGMSVDMATSIVAKATPKYPKILFYLVPDEGSFKQVLAWFDQEIIAVPSGTLGVKAGSSFVDDSGTPVYKSGVSLTAAEAEILAAIDVALASYSQTSIGNRGLSGYAAQTASATITPLRANRSGSNRGVFRAVVEAVKNS